MTKFVFAYRGGSTPSSPEEQEAVMAAWGAWFGALGESVVDGGAPFGASTAIGAATSASGLSGYSIVTAADLAAAETAAKGCPILADGGTVEIYEALPM